MSVFGSLAMLMKTGELLLLSGDVDENKWGYLILAKIPQARFSGLFRRQKAERGPCRIPDPESQAPLYDTQGARQCRLHPPTQTRRG